MNVYQRPSQITNGFGNGSHGIPGMWSAHAPTRQAIEKARLAAPIASPTTHAGNRSAGSWLSPTWSVRRRVVDVEAHDVALRQLDRIRLQETEAEGRPLLDGRSVRVAQQEGPATLA